LLAMVNYPFIQSVEIDGTAVAIDQYGETQPLAFTDILVKNEGGFIVGEGKTEFDGYFYINQLPPGKYSVSISKQAIIEKQLFETNDVKIHLEKPGAIISGIELKSQVRAKLDGYLNYIGYFSSPKAAKAFKRIFQSRQLPLELRKNTFITYDQNKKLFYVGVNFAKSQSSAEAFCSYYRQSLAKCEVMEHQIVQ